ncbi:NAD(P)-dependent oxidoreductase [Rhizobium sp.]|uniref:NAD-dependent epimerase/dehydratase family protein n=1 Tax=Rhizobium sp. TaxID=391 RepID=UPI002AA67B40
MVTGATGFLGGNLVAALAASARTVLAVGRDPQTCARLRSVGFNVLSQDLALPLDISSHPMLGDVNTIVHCAAHSAPFGLPADFVRANVTVTRNLIEFARQRNTRRFIYISTPSVYFAFRDQMDVREDMALPGPVNDYARTKRQAEKLVLAAEDIGPVILRPRGIYGAGDTTLLPRLLKVARKRPLPLFRSGRACIDLTYIDDVVAAIVAALDCDRKVEGEIFNISGGEVLPVQDIVNQACARAGITARWKPASLAPAMIAAGVMEMAARLSPVPFEPPITRYSLGLFAYAQSLDISKAQRLLGWKPKTVFEDGVDQTFKNGEAL